MENNAQNLKNDKDLIARQNIHLNARVSSQGSNFRIRQSQSPTGDDSPVRRKKIQQHSWEEIKKLKKYNAEKEEQKRLADLQKQKEEAMMPKKVAKKKTKKVVKKKEQATPNNEEIKQEMPTFEPKPMVQNMLQEPKKETSASESYSEDDRSDDSLFHEVEQLKDNVEELQLQYAANQKQFDDFKDNFMAKASEKTIAFYLKKIAGSLHRECGEKMYTSSADSGLANQSQMAELYQSEDSLLLKDSAQMLYDKFQIVGMNLVNQKKYKKSSQQQIYKIEEQLKGTVKQATFQSEVEGIEKRLR